MSDHDEATRLAAALEAGLRGLEIPFTTRTRATLHASVCEYVDGLKALGWPPERVIVAVKRIVSDAGLRPSSPMVLTDKNLTGVDRVRVEIVGWCIERYYGDAPSTISDRKGEGRST